MLVNGNKLSMTKGDSEFLTAYMTTAEGVVVELVAGDTLYFTVKESPLDEDFVFQKVITTFNVDGKAEIEILPEDTEDIELLTYYKTLYYDVQVNLVDGSVKTIIRPSSFIVTWGVTSD